jgi:phage-related protein|nr:type II toxin-antitoxin system RelE/ParE family toxin [uncultured Dialister sp.]
MEIKFYEDQTGRVPVKEFLDGLDIKMRQKMLRSIQALQDMGISLRMPLSESLEDGIFELRAKSGTNISRVMYFFIIGNRAVLTHGFIKKTQKTPRRELQRAKDIRADYFRRFGR